jgi:hypothetical protein
MPKKKGFVNRFPKKIIAIFASQATFRVQDPHRLMLPFRYRADAEINLDYRRHGIWIGTSEGPSFLYRKRHDMMDWRLEGFGLDFTLHSVV